MNCDEFRRQWLDGERGEHHDGCPACAAWEERQQALDGALTSALLVAPPADLSARLSEIPAMVARPAAETAGQDFLELAFLVVAALGAIGLSGAAVALVLSLVWPIAADALQVIPLILDSPLIGYYQSVASTLLEALATLVLVALVILQMRPGAAQDAMTPSGRP